jgi:hypothetical protein
VKNFNVLCAAIALSALTGCYPVKQYQSNIVGVVPPTPNSTGVIPLAFVEFDDNGQLFSHAQLDNTVQAMERLKAACPSGFTAVLFIHGWKNNASPDANNVAGFEAFLRQVYPQVKEGAQRYGCADPLIGIYIGWRGARVRVGANFSYWNGSNAAVRAGGPGLEEALYRIMRTARPSQSEESNLILIGHSFGGRVLEKVMTPYLETEILNELRHESYHGGAMSFPLPTLTVLLNEAAPATDAKQFLDFLKNHQVTYTDGEKRLPLFLSITSDGDWATHILLPVGQAAARMQMKTRVYCTGNVEADRKSGCSGDQADPGVITNQSTYFTHSTANIPALYSHYFVQGDLGAALQCQEKDPAVMPVFSAGKYSYLVCATAGAWNQTPYWVSSLPVSIVPDHSDIFHPQLYETLMSFIQDRLQHRGQPPVIRAVQ